MEVEHKETIGDESQALIPACHCFPDRFQEVLEWGKQLAGHAARVLPDYAVINYLVVGRLVERATALSNFCIRDSRIIALRGDTGQGKSSLINSLLDCPGLAETSDWGRGCTTVVAEYRYKANASIAPFRVEFLFLAGAEIDKMIEELVYSYRRTKIPGVEDDDDFEEFQRESQVAWWSLESAFGHRAGLKTLCDNTGEGAYQKIVNQLLEWVEEISWPEGCDAGVWGEDFHTAREVSDKISALTENRLWPFTKTTRIYLDAPILRNGVILVDLPGQRDVNLARLQMTKEYLLRADHTFIVVDIKRAASDQSLKTALLDELNKEVDFKTGSNDIRRLDATIVCTHAEDLNIVEAKRKILKFPSKHARVVAELEVALGQAGRSGDWTTKPTLEKELKQRLMKARNESIQTDIRKAYEEELRGSSLDIYCVSNVDYAEFAESGNEEIAKASGIPQLHQHCYSVISGAMFFETENFLCAELPALLKSIELFVDALPTGNDRPTRHFGSGHRIYQGPTVSFEDAFGSADQNLKIFHDIFISEMETHETRWDKFALTTSEVWEKWHHASYATWCRHDGTHQTRKCGPVQWNADLGKTSKLYMRSRWTALEKGVSKEVMKLARVIKKRFTALANGFRKSSNLSRAIRLQRGSISHQFKAVKRHATKEIRVLRRKALEDNPESLLLDYMRPAYRDAAMEMGIGYNKRQIDIVKYQIKRGIFKAIRENLDCSVAKLIQSGCARLREIVAESGNVIKRDLGITYGAGTAASNCIAEERGELEELVREWGVEYAKIEKAFERVKEEQT